LYGREHVRRGFDESTEFQNLMATMAPNGGITSAVSSLLTARVDPGNQPGGGLLTRDAQWSVPLLSLPGRAGLDLGLSLSYSSMVWTRSGPYIYFDEDNGWPSPGFRLGFPTIQEMFFDAQIGQNAYVLISAGGRVELRQVGTSNVYEAADSSYLQLIDNGGSLLLRTTDGTQLNFLIFNNEWHCTQIKDRNGNYITVNYDWLGHITTIVDTLGRTITFDYDSNANLQKIKQSWAGQPLPHEWATFGWTTKTIQPSSSGVMVVGAANPATIPVINQVGLDDGSYYTFEYNTTGQVNPIRSYRSDNVERAYTAYDYDSPADDCPRLIDTHLWAIYHRDFANLATTLHYVDSQLDTGDIVFQSQVRLHQESKLYELRALNTQLCVELCLLALTTLDSVGSLPSRKQVSQGRYYSFMPAVLKADCVNKFDTYVKTL